MGGDFEEAGPTECVSNPVAIAVPIPAAVAVPVPDANAGGGVTVANGVAGGGVAVADTVSRRAAVAVAVAIGDRRQAPGGPLPALRGPLPPGGAPPVRLAWGVPPSMTGMPIVCRRRWRRGRPPRGPSVGGGGGAPPAWTAPYDCSGGCVCTRRSE